MTEPQNSNLQFEPKLLKKLKKTQTSFNDALTNLSDLEEAIHQSREALKAQMEASLLDGRFSQFDPDLVNAFMEEPYVILPKKEEEWWVIAPKFVDFQIGWLERATPSYNIFIINKFMSWLADIPPQLQKLFKWKPKLPLTLHDGILLTGEDHQEETWARYSPYLLRREGADRIRIRKGKEYELIAALIRDGILPFVPKPVMDEDLRSHEVRFILRDYQEEAWQQFLKYGAIGVFWAFSAGKTFLGMKALAAIKGKKAVIVPTRILKEQWAQRIRQYTYIPYGEVQIETYFSYHKLKKKRFKLIIFDEVHRLPANTFSRLATLLTDYRIGLSGTPYREDGRTDLIFALTGFPLGLDWHTLLELGVFKKPDIKLYVGSSIQDKLNKLEELLQTPSKTLIFSDSISLGKRIAKKFNLPFVYGETTKRLPVVQQSETTVVSRVADEGISLPDIERVIEVDFLYGSRRQEAQRMGRTFHGQTKGEHIILMTEEELEKYEKRLFAIYEKGWRIDIIR